MFAKLSSAACVAVLVALAGSVTAAPGGNPDPRVENAVKMLSYEYEVTNSGAVMVLVPLGNGRARPVFITPETDTNGGAETRVIFSVARIYDGSVPFPAADAIDQANKELSSGKYAVIDGGDGKKVVIFVSRVNANATALELDSAIKAASGKATSLSLELGKLS